MSAALKRRFNFETVFPIADIADELALVARETGRLLERAGIPAAAAARTSRRCSCTTFHELRTGQTADGKAIEPLTTAMSTAEAVSVGFAACVQAHYFGRRRAAAPSTSRSTSSARRSRTSPRTSSGCATTSSTRCAGAAGGAWKDLYAARALLA